MWNLLMFIYICFSMQMFFGASFICPGICKFTQRFIHVHRFLWNISATCPKLPPFWVNWILDIGTLPCTNITFWKMDPD